MDGEYESSGFVAFGFGVLDFSPASWRFAPASIQSGIEAAVDDIESEGGECQPCLCDFAVDGLLVWHQSGEVPGGLAEGNGGRSAVFLAGAVASTDDGDE